MTRPMSSTQPKSTSVRVKTESSSAVKSSVAKAPIIKHSKFFFDNTLVVIQIENVQFNVHKYQLMKSETFSDMFAIAESSNNGGSAMEGSSTDNPIIMEGVSATDFESLLTVLYATYRIRFPSHFSTDQPAPEASLIIPAFRLANKWNFADLRAYLIPLAEKSLGDVDKIVFAREFDIKDWLAPAHTRLCQRKEALTSEEASKLGVDSLLLICRIQGEKLTTAGTLPRCPSHPNNSQLRCISCSSYVYPQSSTMTDSTVEQKVKAWIESGCVFTT